MTYTIPTFRPFVVVWENTFEQNSAYSSGNAVYVRSTRSRRVVSEEEQDRVCGQFHAELNTFAYNKAILKSHNGGAIALSCDFTDLEDARFAGRTSDYIHTNYYRKEGMSDLATREQMSVYAWASGIKDNTFVGNTAG